MLFSPEETICEEESEAVQEVVEKKVEAEDDLETLGGDIDDIPDDQKTKLRTDPMSFDKFLDYMEFF